MAKSNADRLADALPKFRTDYESNVGRLNGVFHCPILYETVTNLGELCWGHVVPEALGGGTMGVPQLSSVDSFFGSVFESGCVDHEKVRSHDTLDILTDPSLRKRLKPKVNVDGEPHTPIPLERMPESLPGTNLLYEIEHSGGTSLFGLKGPAEFSWDNGQEHPKFEIVVERDARSAHAGMALHSAHLTLFRLLGYSYAYGTGGRYLGNDILGTFYRECRGKHKEGSRRADDFLQENSAWFRPVQTNGQSIGTVSDRELLVFVDMNKKPWALGVVVQPRTGRIMVIVPTMESGDAVETALKFQESPFAWLSYQHARLIPNGSAFEISPEIKRVRWPTID